MSLSQINADLFPFPAPLAEQESTMAIAEQKLAERVVVEATPPSPVPFLPRAMPATLPRRSLRRVVALPVWRLFRPVARPMLWRVRSFLTADAVRELAALRAAHETLQGAARDTVRELAALRAAHEAQHEATRDAVRAALQEAVSRAAPPPMACVEAPCRTSRDGPSHGLGLGDTAAERWLLTVALEATAAQPA
jgi:hypothetical protein